MSASLADAARAAVALVATMAETVRARGEIPSGELYALLMPSGVSLDAYESAVGVLRRAGLVDVTAHVLRWVGPQIAEAAPPKVVPDWSPERQSRVLAGIERKAGSR